MTAKAFIEQLYWRRSETRRNEMLDRCFGRTDRVDDWDLVDLAAQMPRTMLRYAIERLDNDLKHHYRGSR